MRIFRTGKLGRAEVGGGTDSSDILTVAISNGGKDNHGQVRLQSTKQVLVRYSFVPNSSVALDPTSAFPVYTRFPDPSVQGMCFFWLLIGSVCCRLRLQVSQLLLKLKSAWILYRVISSWEQLCGDIVQTVPLCLSGKIRYLAYTSVHAPAMHVREAMIFESLGLTLSM